MELVFRTVEKMTWNTHVEAFGTAAGVVTAENIIETLVSLQRMCEKNVCISKVNSSYLLIQEGVQKAKRWLLLLDPGIVEQRNDASKSGRRGRCSTNGNWLSFVEDTEVVSQSCDIRNTTTGPVEFALIEVVGELFEVTLDGAVLVSGTGEVVGETSTAVETR